MSLLRYRWRVAWKARPGHWLFLPLSAQRSFRFRWTAALWAWWTRRQFRDQAGKPIRPETTIERIR